MLPQYVTLTCGEQSGETLESQKCHRQWFPQMPLKGQSAPSSVPTIQFQTQFLIKSLLSKSGGEGSGTLDILEGTSELALPAISLCQGVFIWKTAEEPRLLTSKFPEEGKGCERQCLPTGAAHPEMPVHCGAHPQQVKKRTQGHPREPRPLIFL